MWSPFRSRAIICHGTKFNVPERNRFWNTLYQSAHFRFYLVGKTNKSWIARNPEQSASFAAALLRIVSAGGKVKILSHTDPDVRAATSKFIDEFMFTELRELPEHYRQARISQLEHNFLYVVTGSSSYRAVVSDHRLVLIPSLNSIAFRDEAPVFELAEHSPEFNSYMSDIERMFEQEADIVPIAWRRAMVTPPNNTASPSERSM